MGRIYNFSPGSTVTENAGMWLSKIDRGLSDEEVGELRDWLAEDPSNEKVFLAMAKTWDEMAAMEALADLFPDRNENQNRSRGMQLSIAATIIGALVTVSWLVVATVSKNSPDIVGDTAGLPVLVYETGIGEQSVTTLADGSTITLNTNSRLNVQYLAHQRILELERGEVHIEVAADPRRPLTLLAGDNIVQALGTAFGVQLIDVNKAELIVTEGEVLVGATVRTAQEFEPTLPIVPVLPVTSLRVEQGESLVMGAATQTVKPESAESIDAMMSWREGNLIFRGDRLEDALKELERYTTVRFKFLQVELRSQTVTGRYKAGDVDAFLLALGASHNISYTRTDNNEVLLSLL